MSATSQLVLPPSVIHQPLALCMHSNYNHTNDTHVDIHSAHVLGNELR